MQVHGVLKILRRHMLERAYFDNAGVVDQDIDFAKAIDNLSNSQLSLSGIEQIAFNRENFAAAGNKISLCTHQFVRIACNDRNVAAARANMAGEHESESARPTGDEHNFIVQRVAYAPNEARDQPEHQHNSACSQENAKSH